MKSLRFYAAAAALAFLGGLLAGCDANAPNSLERNVGVDYSGFYNGQNAGGKISSQNSGAPITAMNLRQTGANLQAVDNNGYVWNGNIGNNPDADNLQATFVLKGRTSVGDNVTVNGTLTKDTAGATTATMSGTWIEPTFYAIVSAIGSVSVTSTNSGGGTLTISPSTTTVGVGSTQVFTAAGGSGTINWSVSGGGSVSPSTGTSTTFTRSTAGTVTLTASSGSSTATATIN